MNQRNRLKCTPAVFVHVSRFAGAVDTHLRRSGGRTDLGEMAQMVAAEALTTLGTQKATSLFETTPSDVQQAFKSFTTSKQFSSLAKEFFTRLTKKYLTSFLSREFSNYVDGDPRSRFPTLIRAILC